MQQVEEDSFLYVCPAASALVCPLRFPGVEAEAGTWAPGLQGGAPEKGWPGPGSRGAGRSRHTEPGLGSLPQLSVTGLALNELTSRRHGWSLLGLMYLWGAPGGAELASCSSWSRVVHRPLPRAGVALGCDKSPSLGLSENVLECATLSSVFCLMLWGRGQAATVARHRQACCPHWRAQAGRPRG